jgi:hypothetical protein
MSVVERARQDIAEHRLWRARDRLTGALGHRPHDAEVLNLLADVYLAMGDVPAAGRLLMLSGRDDEAASEARRAFEWRHRRSVFDLASSLPAKPPLDDYPAAARARLDAVAGQLRAERREVAWMRGGTRAAAAHHGVLGPLGNWVAAAAVIFVLVLPWVAGVILVVALLIGAIHFG